jgi:Zn finger protein HypA/HybF involved in hydrogenase expression
MIDLNELEQRFDKLLETENEQTFNNWLHNHRKQQRMKTITKGATLAMEKRTIPEEFIGVKIECVNCNHAHFYEKRRFRSRNGIERNYCPKCGAVSFYRPR